MTVFDLLGRVPDDSRVLEFAEPLAALNAEFPGLAPKEYRGERSSDLLRSSYLHHEHLSKYQPKCFHLFHLLRRSLLS